MLRIRATNRTIVGYVRCARFPQMQALASLFACGQPEGVHAAGGTASPRRAPEKKKNPIKSGSFFSSVVEMRGRSKQRLRNSEVSEFTRINAAPARRGSRRRWHGIAAQSPRKENEPDKIGFVFFICGGDEGGRTPYLLNAIQALYQLSYTPKADNKRKYTIFTSFCQLHLNKWVKCFGTNFFVYLIHSRFARARAART